MNVLSLQEASQLDLIEMNDRFHDSALLHFGDKVGLFDFLRNPATSEQIAQNFGWVDRKTMITMDSLVALGLLVKKDGTYENTETVNQVLVKNAPLSLSPVVEHQRLQWDLWSRIEDVLSSETSIPEQQELLLQRDEHASEVYNRAMRNLSVKNIDRFLEMCIVREGDHILDLAGGHGHYLSRIASAIPNVTGELWDLSSVESMAKKSLSEAEITDRFQFFAKDIADLSNYRDVSADVILLNNCLHYFDGEKAREIVTYCANCLKPGGRLIITAVSLEENRVEPSTAARFAFHMLLNSSAGGLHPTGLLSEAMRQSDLQVSQTDGGSLGVMGVTVLLGKRGF